VTSITTDACGVERTGMCGELLLLANKAMQWQWWWFKQPRACVHALHVQSNAEAPS
jgi:hypothetical protein